MGIGKQSHMKTLGSRIRFVRGALSQEVFAAKLGVSKGSLGGYERDENLPNSDIVLKICQETGVSAEWLLQGEGLPRMSVDESASQENSLAGDMLALSRAKGGPRMLQGRRAELRSFQTKRRSSRNVRGAVGLKRGLSASKMNAGI